MGLREKKAQRGRERVVTEAMALFAHNGYEQTTMEAIAEAADISHQLSIAIFQAKTSSFLRASPRIPPRFADVFALRANEMSVERALGEAIFAVLAVEDEAPKHALLVRSILGQSPVARARLWDYLGEQQHSLAKQLAERLQLKEDDPSIILTARIALEILLAAADIWRASKGRGIFPCHRGESDETPARQKRSVS